MRNNNLHFENLYKNAGKLYDNNTINASVNRQKRIFKKIDWSIHT